MKNKRQNFNNIMMIEKQEITSQRIIASWLIPFLPCLLNKEALSVDPFKKSLPGILCNHISILESKEEDSLPFIFFFRKAEEEEQDDAAVYGTPLEPSPDKHDPIPKALAMFSKHSRLTKQSGPLTSNLSIAYFSKLNKVIKKKKTCKQK